MEPTATGMIIAALVGLISGVVSLVAFPLIAYIVRRRDNEIDRITLLVEKLEKVDTEHEVRITELRGDIKTISLVHTEIRDIRSAMLTKSEFDYRIAALERELTQVKK